MNRIKVILFPFLIIASVLQAQSFDAAGLGYADVYLSNSRGLDAFSRNPANLAYDSDNFIAFRFPALNINVGNNSLSLSDYNRYFTRTGNGGEWSESDQQAIIDLIPDEGMGINASLGMAPFALRIGNFAIGAAVVAQGNVTVDNRQLLEYLFNEIHITENFNFDKDAIAKGGFYSAVKISAAYGQLLNYTYHPWWLDEIAVGVRANLFMGIAAAQVEQAAVNVKRTANGDQFDDGYVTTLNKVTVNFATPENGLPGMGFGLDLAATARWKKEWYFSMALENGIGSIRWNNSPQQFQLFMQDTLYFNGDSTKNSVSEDTVKYIDEFSTPLPVSLTAGAMWQFNDQLTLAAQWRQYLTRDLGTPLTPEIGFSASYRLIPMIVLRTGMRFGGKENFVFGLGTGFYFGTLQLDLGYAMRQALWPSLSNAALFSFAMTFGF